MLRNVNFCVSMKICVISPGYPDHKTNECVFVAQLVEEMARLGNECYVIAPYSITRNRSFCKKKEVSQIGKGSITIIRPNYISVANVKIGGRSLSDIFHYRAVKRAFKEIPSDIECIYGHFWHSAIEGYEYAKAHNIPGISQGCADRRKSLCTAPRRYGCGSPSPHLQPSAPLQHRSPAQPGTPAAHIP